MLLAGSGKPVPDDSIEIAVPIDIAEGCRTAENRIAAWRLAQPGRGVGTFLVEQIKIALQISRPEKVQPAVTIDVDKCDIEDRYVLLSGHVHLDRRKALTLLVHEDDDQSPIG